MTFETPGRGDVPQLIPDHRNATVEGWETVRVPAGEFRSLRVFNEGSRRVHKRDGEFYESVREVVWYSPQAKSYVKRETWVRQLSHTSKNRHAIHELLEYDVK